MANVAIPTHKDWSSLKKLHGVADGAVSGIDMGKALDFYHNNTKGSVRFIKHNLELLDKTEKVFVAYIGKLDKKKVKKDYEKFKKHFLDEYAGTAHHLKEDLKRYEPDVDTYKKDIAKFFTMVQQFPPHKTTEEELQKFRSGALRGLTAGGSRLKAVHVDLTHIEKTAGDMQKVIDKTVGAKDAGVFEKARTDLIALAEQISAEMKTQGLVD